MRIGMGDLDWRVPSVIIRVCPFVTRSILNLIPSRRSALGEPFREKKVASISIVLMQDLTLNYSISTKGTILVRLDRSL
jgi:hypothetical protein